MTAKLTPLQDLQIKLMRHYGPKSEERGNHYHYLALDPGEGTGWAIFSETGYLMDFGNVYDDVNGVADLFARLRDYYAGAEPKVIIYEKWKLLKTKEFYG